MNKYVIAVCMLVVLLSGVSIGYAATKPVYHIVDPGGLQVFSPDVQSRVVCYVMDVRRNETTSSFGGSPSNPMIPTRSAGLSCIQMNKADYDNWSMRYPVE